MPSQPASSGSRYRGYRFPPEVLAHAVWLNFRLHLSFRDAEELLAARGIGVSYEAIRHWCYTFGPSYATDLRRRRARPGDKWHLDEVLLKMRGKRHWLWRAVDQDGVVLDILLPERRGQAAAERFLRQLLRSCEYEPRVVITDKLASYVPAVSWVGIVSSRARPPRAHGRAPAGPNPATPRRCKSTLSGTPAPRPLGAASPARRRTSGRSPGSSFGRAIHRAAASKRRRPTSQKAAAPMV